jgi:DNA-binding MarR family transcriptional regulator
MLRQQDQSGFGATLVAALGTIESLGPLTLGDLAAREQVAPPTITKVVEKLESHGLIERTADAADRRVTRVIITATGSRELQTFRERRTEWLLARLAELEPDEVNRVLSAVPVLEKIIGAPEAPR